MYSNTKSKPTDKNFKLPRHYKYLLSQITDPHLRGAWKRSYIQGTLAAESHSRAKYIDIFVNAKNFKETV